MDKEFLDFMYEQRFILQSKIDKLEEMDKQPKNGDCKDCGNTIKYELQGLREGIFSVNKIIEKYIY